MIAASAYGLVAAALSAWTLIAFGLVRRAQIRAFGSAAFPWLALASAACIGVIAIALHPPPHAALGGIACIALALAADADARTGYLFDAITIPTALLVLLVAGIIGFGLQAALGCSVLVMAFGAIVFVSRGRAMGFGDVKAIASIGAAFGLTEALLAVAAACTSGIVEAVLRGRFERRAEIRFGPHLAIGATFALAFGGQLNRSFIGV